MLVDTQLFVAGVSRSQPVVGPRVVGESEGGGSLNPVVVAAAAFKPSAVLCLIQRTVAATSLAWINWLRSLLQLAVQLVDAVGHFLMGPTVALGKLHTPGKVSKAPRKVFQVSASFSLGAVGSSHTAHLDHRHGLDTLALTWPPAATHKRLRR